LHGVRVHPEGPGGVRLQWLRGASALYWCDRTNDGPAHHIDSVFLPTAWIGKVSHLSVGAFEAWCGAGLSDHVPVVVDVDV
jgi:exodeoxyribonuclease-3